MNLKELKDLIDDEYSRVPVWTTADSIRVGIVVKTVGSIGGTPVVDIKNIQAGFDWDNGKLMIFPEKDLRSIEADELAALRKESEKQGWAEYENRNLKAEIKRLRKQLGVEE